MSKQEVVEAPIQVPVEGEQQEPQVTTVVEIKIYDNGGIQINVPEGYRELQPIEIEGITRTVSEQLRDARIAQQAVDMFKARLG